MRHRFGKGVVGLVAGLAAICLLSLPAAANTGTLEFINSTTGTPGNITVYNADSEPVTVVTVPSPTGLTCSTGANGITATTSGSTSGTITIVFTNNCGSFFTGSGTTSVLWCSYMSGTITGTYTHITTGTNSSKHQYTSASVDPPGITVVLRKNTGTNCHSTTTTFCTITVTGFAVSGFLTSANSHTLDVSDTATVIGNSPLGSVVVTGTATACGLFIGANDGHTSINAHLHVTSVP